jgi:hypothetical protein
VDAKLGAMIEAGQKVACEELPVVCEPDGDPSYWRSLVRDSRKGRDEVEVPF